MTITTSDGTTITGSPPEIVEELRLSARITDSVDNAGYMREAAGRIKLMYSTEPRVDTPENFLEDLASCGAIIVTEGS